MPEIIVPVSVGLRGDVKMIMRDVVTGEVETREIRNTLLNFLLDGFFSETSMFGGGKGLLNSINVNCLIGTSNQPASHSDTGVIGTLLASRSGASAYSGTNPRIRTITTVFPAGTGTGTIQEVVQANSSRQVVSPALNKTDQHELTVVWTFSLYRGADSWSGVIPAGQRDGVTDINWVATINNKQLEYWGNIGVNATWDASVGLSTGTSNAASDLINDLDITIKGTTIKSSFFPTYREALAYTAGNLYRDVRLGLETTESNGAIGEMVISVTGRGIFRITFTPALDKVDTYRLYLTFRIAVVNAS